MNVVLNISPYIVIVWFVDSMVWSKPAVRGAVPLPRSLHSATTTGNRWVSA